jgi:uncharacterized membrane protein
MDAARDKNVRKSVVNLYAIFGVSIILSILPFASAAFLSLVFFVIVLVCAYRVRKSATEHAFGHSHAVFIIRTIWISGLFALVTTAVASAYMLSGINYAPFESCSNALVEKGVAWIEAAGMKEVYTLIQPCIHDFFNINKTLIINAVIIAGGPVLIYMGYRFYKGLNRAIKGYMLAENKDWF